MTTFQSLDLTPLSMYEVETPPDIRRAVLYVRVSSTAGGTGSVEDQETVLREVCEAHGWPVHPRVFGDPGIGASRQAQKTKGRRKEFEDLLKTLGSNDILMTVADNRAHRNAETYVEIRKVCAEVGAYWYYGDQVYDMNKGRDRVRTLQDASRSEGMIEDMLLAADRGRRRAAIDGKPPGKLAYGYKDVSIKGRKGIQPSITEDGRAIYRAAHPEQGPVVKELFERVANNEPTSTIMRDFYQRGIRRRDGKEFADSGIRTILQNPTYAGLRKFQGALVSRGAWEPLVSEETFLAVQKNLADPGRKTNLQHGSTPRYLLSGIAWCGVCNIRKVRRLDHNDGYEYYTCNREEGGEAHLSRSLKFTDGIVVQELVWAASDTGTIKRILDSTPDYSEVDRLIRDAKEEEEYLDSYRRSAADRSQGISPQALAMVERESLPKIQRWYNRAQEIRNAVKSHNPFVDMALSEDPQEYWDNLPLSTKREIIKRTLRVVILPSPRAKKDPEAISVQWLDTLQNDAEVAV